MYENWVTLKSQVCACFIFLDTEQSVACVTRGRIKGLAWSFYSPPYEPLYFSRYTQFERVFHFISFPAKDFSIYFYFSWLAKYDLFKNPHLKLVTIWKIWRCKRYYFPIWKNIFTLNRYKYSTEISRFAKKCNTRTVHITYISCICCLGKNISSNQMTIDFVVSRFCGFAHSISGTSNADRFCGFIVSWFSPLLSLGH